MEASLGGVVVGVVLGLFGAVLFFVRRGSGAGVLRCSCRDCGFA